MSDVASQAKFASAHAAKHASAAQAQARSNRAETPDNAFAEMLDSAASLAKSESKPEPKPEPKSRAGEPGRRDEVRASDKRDAAPRSDDKTETAQTEPADGESIAACETAAETKVEAEIAPQLLTLPVDAETAVADDKAKPEKPDLAADAAALTLPFVPAPEKPVEIAVALAPITAPNSEVEGETPELAAPKPQAIQSTTPAPVLPEAAASNDSATKPQTVDGKPQFHVDTADKPAVPATVEAHAARLAAAAADAAPDLGNANQPATQQTNTPHAAQPIHLNTQAAQATAPASASANPAAATTPIPLHAVAVEIAARANAGGKRFDIRLDPPELGKIDVRLDIDRHGQVTSRLIVEKAETLDLLRRDAPQLERALQDAGLKTSNNGLQFSLQQQMSQQDDNGGRLTGTAQLAIVDETIAPDIVQRGYAQLAAARGGVDIRV